MKRALAWKAAIAVLLPFVMIALAIALPWPLARSIVIIAGGIAGVLLGVNFDRRTARWAYDRARTAPPPRL